MLILLCLCYNCCHLMLAPSIACCSCFNCISSIYEYATSFIISSYTVSAAYNCKYCDSATSSQEEEQQLQSPVDRLLEAGKNSPTICWLVSPPLDVTTRDLVLLCRCSNWSSEQIVVVAAGTSIDTGLVGRSGGTILLRLSLQRSEKERDLCVSLVL